MKHPTRAQLSAAHGRKVPDVIAPGLCVLFVGINPSLYSAAVGHHFARPGNRFWPALFGAGITPRLMSSFEEQELIRCGCGITNLVERATARADELSRDELKAGAKRLAAKVVRYRIATVAFLGLTAYRAAYGRSVVEVGSQPHAIGSAAVWVLPNPSGRNAHYRQRDFDRLFAELKSATARS